MKFGKCKNTKPIEEPKVPEKVEIPNKVKPANGFEYRGTIHATLGDATRAYHRELLREIFPTDSREVFNFGQTRYYTQESILNKVNQIREALEKSLVIE